MAPVDVKPCRVIVSEFGEALVPYGGDPRGYSAPSEVLVHDICGGAVRQSVTSATHVALNCNHCHLRVVVPASIKTVADLKKHFTRYNKG